MYKKLYLVNSKVAEPAFPQYFENVARENGAAFEEIDIQDISFFCPSEQDIPIQAFNKKEPFTPTPQDYFFIRKWRPNGEATTLLVLFLTKLGIPVSEQDLNLSHDILSSKLSQNIQLKGIAAFPSTWICTIRSLELNFEAIANTFSFPVVLKIKGAQGKRVWKCTSKEELFSKAKEVHTKYDAQLFMIQEFTPNSFDIRVIVFKNEILTSIKRSSNNGFLNNISQGGSAEAIELTEEERRISLASAKELRLELAGVDIVRTQKGPLLFEVNKAPDISCFSPAAGFSIEEKIAQRIFDAQE